MLRQAQLFRNWDGAFTKGLETLTGGAFLVGFALALGASDLQIGLIAAIPLMAQIMNIPAIWVVERVRRRKLICLTGSLISRSLWVPIALSPFLLGPRIALMMLMGALALGATIGAFSGLSWNSWMKDLLPGPLRGRMFSFRLWVMGLVGMGLSLTAAVVVDLWSGGSPLTSGGEQVLTPLSALYLAGGALGLVGLFFLSRIPEPTMPAHEGFSLRAALVGPLEDGRFRKLIGFTSSWAFASNLALPFIPVYLLKVLGYPFSTVMIFAIASQLANLALLNIWGRLADRFGNKSVLFVCAPVFSLSLLLWVLTVEGDQWFTLTLIGLIHVMNGMATAGIDVANANLLYHMAPQRLSSAYFSTAALVNAVAAGVAPILGGALGNAFRDRAITLSWGTLESPEHVKILQIAYLDFVFLAAFLAGLFALGRLARVEERPEEIPHAQVIQSLKQEIQNLSTIKGLRYLTQPASFLAGVLLEAGAVVRRAGAVEGRGPQQDVKP